MKRENVQAESSPVRFSLKEVHIDKKTLITCFVMFFMGRAWLPGGIMPFGTAAFAAAVISEDCNLKKENALMYGIAILLGSVTLMQWWQVLIAVLVMLMFYSVMKIKSGVSKQSRLPFSVKAGIIYFVCSIGASVVAIAMSSAKFSDIFVLLLQAIIGFAAFYVFRNVLIIFTDDIGRRVMSNEEMACIAIVAAISIMGLPDIVFLEVSLKRILCAVIVMVFSYRGGLGTGAACGVISGILITASKAASGNEISAAIIAVYGFSGFLAGLFNKYKKFGVCAGFIIGNLILAILFSGSKELIINLYEVGFAVIAFVVLPERMTEFLKLPQLSGVKIPTVKVNYAVKLRNTAVGKLNGFSEILHEMSSVCSDFTDGASVGGCDDMMQIVERMTDKVCKRCLLCSSCWETNFYKSYQSFSVIVSILECKGKILPSEIPPAVANVCPNIGAVIEEIKNGFEVWRMDCLWRRRMEETKKMLPAQLESMSEILKNLANEVDLSVTFDNKAERAIMKKISEHDLKIKNVTVSKNRYGRLEISADIRSCGMRKACIKSYLPLISQAVGVPLVINTEATSEICGFVPPTENSLCHKNSSSPWCPVVFTEAEPFKIAVSAAGCSAHGNKCSGDSHSFIELEHGIYMIAVSDGMGTGEKAAVQSRAVIKLLELFMESGLSSSSAIAMINSLLETGSEKMMSATVDLCLFDMYEGKASFIKLGAVPSVVKHGIHVETVALPSLPMGMAEEYSEIFNCRTVNKKIENGDIVILMSDGVTEAFRNCGENTVDFYGYIENMNTNNPKQIADGILKIALARSNGIAKDDMTVVAARVWQG
ncbi:MAG: stage II sporulation protein E [Clostridia bacterium]|nr:stage II sporulation protein E [Clostridia bacterium]